MVNLNGVSDHFSTGMKWGIIPYVGVGLLSNIDNGHRPFTFSYGILGQYRLSGRLNLTMELGGTTTFKNFDGYGASRKLGDNLLNLSAGLSFTFGKTGWKRVIDAAPFMAKDDWLQKRLYVLGDSYNQLLKEHNASLETVMELKKILDYEGLLDKYQDRLSKNGNAHLRTKPDKYPKNDYSGLNQLRKRLAEVDRNTCRGNDKSVLYAKDDKGELTKSSDINEGLSDSLAMSKTDISSNETSDINVNLSDFLVKYDKELSGAPVHFFSDWERLILLTPLRL
jgi:hypothetical protein